MLPLGDTTILGNILNIFKSSGIEKVSIVVGHKAEIIQDYIKNINMGIDVSFIEQKERLGTGHALMIASYYVNSDFICVYGDLLFKENFIVSLISKFKSSGSIAMMALTESDTPEFFGSVTVEGSEVTGIFEKSDTPPSNLINTGIYCFKKEAFSYINNTKISPRGEYELTDSLKMMMGGGNKVMWMPLDGKWLDIGRPWDLIDANMFFLESVKNYVSKDSKISPDSQIGSPVYIDSFSVIDSSEIISPCLLSKNVNIGTSSKISSSVIRKNVKIGSNCTIENSVVMEGAKIGNNSFISFSVIGENSDVGKNVILESKSEGTIKFKIKGELVDSNRTQLGSVVGKNVKIKDNSVIRPGQKIESNSII
ncbi:MAG: Bifunctional protein GlmU [Candidatus Methanofastidiosum methylothiophilum]|uniref:Bifunctional protein GlmU n=1 Tax=Candidatus Methanofastidiosum methylothiophilum TaxID=1705564 RepID=A0A150IWA4_9EURY|nr:MAG: Bifunctional protein GlmU [Candidatus Methanofastidiosum methylthiophilus]KYC46600.1 MAG: Bifunctional protein GlmU [Candidatus Methanofastidiosum methylthiophilus]KYC49281.1 MAG: Bifunctional protein GlmU [Candidatus Methanofastidiosum methylthiophilus]